MCTVIIVTVTYLYLVICQNGISLSGMSSLLDLDRKYSGQRSYLSFALSFLSVDIKSVLRSNNILTLLYLEPLLFTLLLNFLQMYLLRIFDGYIYG